MVSLYLLFVASWNWCSPLRLVGRQAKNILHIASSVENSDNLQRLRLVPVDDQVRIEQKEAVPFVGEFLSPMADAGSLCQLDHGVVQRIKQPVGGFGAVVGIGIPD